MIPKKRKIFVKKVLTSVTINSMKLQLRIKTDLNNSNDINGTSYKHRRGKDDIRRKKYNPVKKKIFTYLVTA